MLHEAVRHNRPRLVRMLIDEGTNVNFLHFSTGDFKFRSDVYLPRRKHGTYLHVAAAHNYTEIIKMLLDAGANPDIQTQYRFTAVEIAAKSGHEEALDLLRQHTPDSSHWRILPSAAYGGQYQLFRRLLEEGGADLRVEYNARRTLNEAIIVQNPAIIKLMLEAGLPLHSGERDMGWPGFGEFRRREKKKWIITFLSAIGVEVTGPFQSEHKTSYGVRSGGLWVEERTWEWVGKY